MRSTRFAVLLPILSLVSCGLWNTAKRNFNVNQGTGALIDVKQRAIIVRDEPLVVCAEPSPDALSAYAADLAAKVQNGEKLAAALGLKTQESAQNIGLRTQSIQLLRDGFYRACEAFLNRALDEHEYALLVRRYQKYTVALLAIEQLTGAVKPDPSAPLKPQIGGSDEDGQESSEATPKPTAKPTSALPAGEEEDGGTTNGTPKPTITPTPSKTPKPSTSPSPKKSPKPSATPKSKAEKEKKGNQTQQNDGAKKEGHRDMADIAPVVREIVMQILKTQDLIETCFAYLQKDDEKQGSTILRRTCDNVLKTAVSFEIALQKVDSASSPSSGKAEPSEQDLKPNAKTLPFFSQIRESLDRPPTTTEGVPDERAEPSPTPQPQPMSPPTPQPIPSRPTPPAS